MLHVRRVLMKYLCEFFPRYFCKKQFKKILGQDLNLSNPIGLNEKITWLKLNTYRNNLLVSKCSDKYAVREYVTECGYPEILNELYGVWKKAKDITWDKLPSSFVLKCNHGCGYNLLYPDKSAFDYEEALTKLDKWMNEDYWLVFAEFQYKKIPKRIICEKYLGDSLVDYKFYCFNGKALYVLVCVGRIDGKHSHEPGYEDPKFFFFDKKWKMCQLTRDSYNCPEDFKIPRPDNLDEMWEIAEGLCKPFPFVRVDLYDVNGKVIFGELTFTPSAGLDTGRLKKADHLFGNILNLKKEEKQ
ncbi:ATP-grasp fold amidoligase family protein [Butyrivibrio sp. AE2005]|uniref:ATP-grasp fold amidoligase family protein n=1 Tax=Butyrivibrio sp. AE2005 TaxID=1496722 RepID=UPI00047B94A7|nr:ATP-grasp fold amidoligase family protein [Butyrivibrio sp. AE2005]